MGVLGDIFVADRTADASKSAARTQANAQREALAYLKEREAIPQKFREGALTGLGDIYGLGDDVAQSEFFAGLERNPLYGAIMSGRDAGEEAILRNASATGGLRSGNAQYNLADYNTQLKNQALLTAYNDQVSGLQGLAGLPSMAPQIAAGITGIGQTLAQGKIANAQIWNDAYQNTTGNIAGLAKLGLQFSDPSLKDNVKLIGRYGDLNVYSWDWNKEAEKLGLTGSSSGFMADEVEMNRPDLVLVVDGYKVVNYGGIQ